MVAEIERLGGILQKLHGQMAGKFNEVCVIWPVVFLVICQDINYSCLE